MRVLTIVFSEPVARVRSERIDGRRLMLGGCRGTRFGTAGMRRELWLPGEAPLAVDLWDMLALRTAALMDC
jgi:hypothetical protein